METKLCQNCNHEFEITEEDAHYYKKIRVPHPSWCSECRRVRRFSFQNTWNLHWRNCDKCGNRTLSLYSPEQELTVYCQPCWWKDDWDGTEYAMDYDPARPFLDQLKELARKTPYSALTSLYTSLKNSDYSNALAWSKDCSFVFWADFCENVYNSSLLNTLKNSADCIRGFESELCYESIGFEKCYRTFYSEECDNCVDVWFSRNCYNCTNCIGCANLRGESNCIFNVKYSHEEYIARAAEMRLDTRSGIDALQKKADVFFLTESYRAYHGSPLNVNVSGEYVYESKNSHEMYIANGAEDCKWVEFITVHSAKDCRDYSGWGNNATEIYEAVTVGENANSVMFALECWPDVMNLQYCIWNTAGKNNFGCANLKRKQHCILNKEYTKEAFEILRAQIIEDMKVRPYVDALGRTFPYGEFFPLEFSNFPYNKSNAMRFFPKTKEQALAEGYTWSDAIAPVVANSIDGELLPQTIKEVDETILKEAIGCIECGRAYRIAKMEYDLLLKMNLPLPRLCLKCRENRRFKRMNSPKLWDRHCAKCGTDIQTAYNPEGPEIVYCVSCYQQEFV